MRILFLPAFHTNSIGCSFLAHKSQVHNENKARKSAVFAGLAELIIVEGLYRNDRLREIKSRTTSKRGETIAKESKVSLSQQITSCSHMSVYKINMLLMIPQVYLPFLILH